jgi:retinoblastoma-like protein 1
VTLLKQRVGLSHVDIITFYNEVFVPAVKPILVGMVSSSSRAEEKTSAEGVCAIN